MSTPEVPARLERDRRTIVESAVAVFDTAMFDHMTRLAKLMASSSLVPAHLNAVRKEGGTQVAIEEAEAVANCFLVVNQAMSWKMNPFAVAQHTYVNEGKLGFEGKLIAAAINSNPAVVKRLNYVYSGEGMKRKVVVSAQLSSDEEPRTVEGTVEQWLTKTKAGQVNAMWVKQPDQQLCYRGAREWARRWFPEVIVGVFGDDELDFERGDTITTLKHGPSGLKSHLGAGEKKVDDVVDAEVVPPADEAAASTPSGKVPGSLEARINAIQTFASSSDIDVLEVALDAAQQFEWTPADLQVVTDAYNARKYAILSGK